MTEMTQPDNKNELPKKNGLLWLVAVLIFLLTAQSAAVVYYLVGKSHSAAVPESPKKNSAYPYSRNFHQTYDPLFADALNSMSRLEDHFNRMVGQFMATGPDMSDFFGGADDFDFMPTVDLSESSNGYVVKVDLPGLDKDKINITVRDELLTIQGVRQSESLTDDAQKGVFKQERSYGSFSRSLRLPGPVDDTKIAADYKNGVLTIKLPKLPNTETAPKKIAIQ